MYVIPERCATLQGERIPSAILKIVFGVFIYFCMFLNVVWTLASGGYRIVSESDTLAISAMFKLYSHVQRISKLMKGIKSRTKTCERETPRKSRREIMKSSEVVISL